MAMLIDLLPNDIAVALTRLALVASMQPPKYFESELGRAVTDVLVRATQAAKEPTPSVPIVYSDSVVPFRKLR